MDITYRKDHGLVYRKVEDGDKVKYESYHFGLKQWRDSETAFNEFTCRTFDSWPATEEEVNKIINNHK